MPRSTALSPGSGSAYGDVLLTFEVRGLVGKHPGQDFRVGNEFHTDRGTIKDGHFHPLGGGASEKLASFEVNVTPGGSWGSFLHAVRARKPEALNAPVEDGHCSSALCHRANISFRLGERVPFQSRSRALGDDREVVASFDNLRENLEAVGVRLEESTYQLGRKLAFDRAAERFTGESAASANPLLSRAYREPFAEPEKV